MWIFGKRDEAGPPGRHEQATNAHVVTETAHEVTGID